MTRVIDLDKETRPLSEITYPMEEYVTTEACKVCGDLAVDGFCCTCDDNAPKHKCIDCGRPTSHMYCFNCAPDF